MTCSRIYPSAVQQPSPQHLSPENKLKSTFLYWAFKRFFICFTVDFFQYLWIQLLSFSLDEDLPLMVDVVSVSYPKAAIASRLNRPGRQSCCWIPASISGQENVA
ncbi:hypothetical protein HOLleu_41259 [Holothuria leucospilota]|uniref:Uncharacterized protein n=1 Tax=Holothuria leucospilota TaxID=206669 RepID=A0A9Q1BBR1_HOLLE|nr:hypothetical protein HOLleu_41259 [Holothuria leucospilota]